MDNKLWKKKVYIESKKIEDYDFNSELELWEKCNYASHELMELCEILAEIIEASSQKLKIIETNIDTADVNTTLGFKTLLGTKKRSVKSWKRNGLLIGGVTGAVFGAIAGPVSAAAGGILGGAVAAWLIGGGVVGGLTLGLSTRAIYGSAQNKAIKTLQCIENEINQIEETASIHTNNKVQVMIFQNERLGTDGTWSNCHCTNRPEWTDDNGNMLSSPDEISCGLGWKWINKWKIEYRRWNIDNKCYTISDKEGWEFSNNWLESKWRNNHSYGDYVSGINGSQVRRRLWVREKMIDQDSNIQYSSYEDILANQKIENYETDKIKELQIYTLHNLVNVSKLSKNINIQIIKDRLPLINSINMCRFQEKLNDASSKIINISLMKPYGSYLECKIKPNVNDFNEKNNISDRVSIPNTIFDSIHGIIRDINNTQQDIQDETMDQIIILDKLMLNIESNKVKLEELTYKIKEQLKN